ncbi:glycoside hydrolase [Nocardia sp. BMG111209]|uniref:glycoside hydrolase n=1 Tax=Nocardia sp. BMG111209 TaxID=1160137 RepID=UPI00068FE095|nr:glycoside hydrolase [Nocardia sp. BMG111209]
MVMKHVGGTVTPVRYTMTAFTNDSQTDMWVYESSDATHFSLVRRSAYRPPDADPAATPATAPTDKRGLCRDPSAFRHTDGAYYLTYTTAWDGDTIGFARSADRLDWTFLYEYRMPLPGVTNTWAPEWFVDRDNRVHVIVSINDGTGFRPHLMSALDTALNQPQWSIPTPLIGITPAPGTAGYIDTTMRLVKGRYHAFVKNETTKNIEVAVADKLGGPYVFVRVGNWAHWGGDGDGAPREGQCVIPLPDGRWRIYLDAYDLDDPVQGRYVYSDTVTTDLLGEWTTPQPLPGVSGFVRHFTVLLE